jgi:aryl-alcohol dehydrogenase-like predicted oxidoreductase
MRYRSLGSTGIRVSTIGFGGWGIGGRTAGATSYGQTDDVVSRRALEAAFERGITLYDTSNVYGDGHSETLIGQTFRARRERVVIATKAGMLPSYGGSDFSPAALRASLEDSLRRLGTDYVDILQLHNPLPADIRTRPEILGELERLRADGKARAIGFSTKSPDEARELLWTPNLACLQVNLNLLDWRAVDNGLLDAAARVGVGIIARTPLAFGFLSGRIGPDQTFHHHDHRSQLSRSTVRTRVEVADGIMAVVGDDGEPNARVRAALRFCLSFPAVSTAIPGMLTAEEVEANAAAGEAEPYAQDILDRMRDIYCQYEGALSA